MATDLKLIGPIDIDYHDAKAAKCILPEGTKNKVPKKICDEIETELIQYALSKNPELLNVQKASVPEWSIDGVIRGKQKPTNEERDFKVMMGI